MSMLGFVRACLRLRSLTRACSDVRRSDKNSSSITAKTSGRESCYGTLAKLLAVVSKFLVEDAAASVSATLAVLYAALAMYVALAAKCICASRELARDTMPHTVALAQIHCDDAAVLHHVHEPVPRGCFLLRVFPLCRQFRDVNGTPGDTGPRSLLCFVVLCRVCGGCWCGLAS